MRQASSSPLLVVSLHSGWCMQQCCRARERSLWYLSAQLRPVYLWDACQCFTRSKCFFTAVVLLLKVALYDKHCLEGHAWIHIEVREPMSLLWFTPLRTNCLAPQKPWPNTTFGWKVWIYIVLALNLAVSSSMMFLEWHTFNINHLRGLLFVHSPSPEFHWHFSVRFSVDWHPHTHFNSYYVLKTWLL